MVRPQVPGVATLAVILLAGCVAPFEDPAAPILPPRDASVALVCPAPCARVLDDAHVPAWEPDVAVGPLDPGHILVVHNDAGRELLFAQDRYWAWSHVTRDGGATWTHTRLPGGPGAGPSHPLAGYNVMGDQTPRILADGSALVAVIAGDRVYRPLGAHDTLSDARSAVAVLRSPDGGATWPDVPFLVEDAQMTGRWNTPGGRGSMVMPGTSHDYPKLATGKDGSVVLAWARITTPSAQDETVTDILLARSPDGGRTWGPPVVVATAGALNGVSVAIDAAGAIHVAFFQRFTDPRPDVLPLFVATSRDAGATWTKAQVGVAAFMPTLRAVETSQGPRTILAYPEPMEEEGRERPVVRWSDDGGASWTPPLALDAPRAPGRTLLAMDAQGDRVVVAWFHALAATPGEAVVQLRATVIEGGIPSEPLVVQEAIEAFAAELGDYVGLAATPGGAFLTWVSAPSEEKMLMTARLVVD